MKPCTLFITVALLGCGRHNTSAGGDSATVIGTAAPGQFSDVAPGDTAAVIAMMRQTMQSIDGGTATMVQRDTTVIPTGDSVSRHLTVWLENGVARKLVVVDSAGHGQNNTETDVWFMGGDVAVILQVTDAYAFDVDRIVLWTDEALTPRIDATAEILMAKQETLIESVRGWLGNFGLTIP